MILLVFAKIALSSFNLKSLAGNGALVGGQRVGVDSGLGVANRGVDLGSQLQFGNQPSAPHPLGQLGSFFDNARSFFQNLGGMRMFEIRNLI